jgi:hypothetical protein
LDCFQDGGIKAKGSKRHGQRKGVNPEC